MNQRPAIRSPLVQAMRSPLASQAPPYTGPLDSYTTSLWGAYSISKLLTAYAGPAIRVRRSSDNAEQDIALLASGALDSAALLAFAGAGSAFVRIFYDQSGAARALSQAAVASQPRIVNAGVYDGKLVFDGTDDYMGTGANSNAVTAFTCYLRGNLRNTAVDSQIYMEQSADYNTNDGVLTYWESAATGTMVALQANGATARARNYFAERPANNVCGFRWDKAQAVITDKTALFTAGVKRTPTANNNVPPASGSFLARPWFLGARSGPVLPAGIDVNTFVIYEASHSDAVVASISSALA